jgi:secreted trypsin-like serine protease
MTFSLTATVPGPAGAVVSPDGFFNEDADVPQAVRIVQYYTVFTGYERDIATCTGTIVKPRVVLTAAHCLDMSGDYGHRIEYISYAKSKPRWVTIRAKNWVIHQRYNESSTQNDIGMLFLTKAASGVKIAKLPPQGDDLLPAFKNLLLLGWGEDQNGRDPAGLAVAIVDDYTAKAPTYFGRSFNPSTMIAAGRWREDERLFTGACRGDSGGPLFAMFGENAYVVGITSFGIEDCNGEAPTSFTKVAWYTDWIRANWGR